MENYKGTIENKNFVLLWLSQIFSQVTLNLLNFILLLKIYEQTNSAFATSLLWVVYAIPALLVSPIASVAADSVNKKNILIYINLSQSITILVYSIVSSGSFILAYIAVFLYSMLNQFYVPAEMAALPELVKKRNLPFANSLFFITQQISIAIGFGVAGIIHNLLGYKDTLVVSSLMLFAAYLATGMLPELVPSKASRVRGAIRNNIYKLKEGYEYVLKNKFVIYPMLILTLVQSGLVILMVNLPIIAKNILNINPSRAGLVVVLPIAFGTFVGALLTPKMMAGGIRKIRIIMNSLFSLAITLLLISVFKFSGPNLLSMFLTVLLGISYVGVVIPTQTFLQEKIEHKLRGRIFGSFWFMITIASVLPVLLSGALIQMMGIKSMLLLFSFIVGVVVVVVYKRTTKYV